MLNNVKYKKNLRLDLELGNIKSLNKQWGKKNLQKSVCRATSDAFNFIGSKAEKNIIAI